MLFCVVELPVLPVRAGKLRRVPTQLLEVTSVARDRAAHYLRKLGAESASIEQWDMLNLDQRVLVRSGTLLNNGTIRWRKS